MAWSKEQAVTKLLDFVTDEAKDIKDLRRAYDKGVKAIKGNKLLDDEIKAVHLLALRKRFKDASAPAHHVLQAIDQLNKISNLYGEAIEIPDGINFTGYDDLKE